MTRDNDNRVVVATGNRGKIKEIERVLASHGLEFVVQSELGVPEAQETGLTFVENALIKARNAAAFTGLPALADDSGLEVPSLRGAPGIYSARYAGHEATDEENNARLLNELGKAGDPERRACFRCVMVYLRYPNDPMPLIATGTWEGTIRKEPFGDGGFGYDPLFQPDGQSVTAAELDLETKNALSHRGQALAKLVSIFDALKAA